MQGARTSHRPLSVTLRRVGLRGKWMHSAVVALATAAFACSTPTIPQDGTHAAAPRTTLRDPSQRGQLSAPCVAEGVETNKQQSFLTELGCDSLQGFLLGHPLPAERFMAHISQAKRKEGAKRVLDEA